MCEVVPGDFEGFLGLAEEVVVGGGSSLVHSEREEKLSAGNIVLIK